MIRHVSEKSKENGLLSVCAELDERAGRTAIHQTSAIDLVSSLVVEALLS